MSAPTAAIHTAVSRAAHRGGHHRLAAGKLPPRLLERLLQWRGAPDRRVLVGPGCGVAAAAVALGTHRPILKCDPVTFTASRVGWYAVQVNANDVAVMGGRPAWFQPTVLVPPGTGVEVVMRIAREIDRACRALGVAVTGGHTEATDAVTRPVVAGDMQGLLIGRRIITAGGARPGHRLLLTKAAGIEGTAILAQERAPALARALPLTLLRCAAGDRGGLPPLRHRSARTDRLWRVAGHGDGITHRAAAPGAPRGLSVVGARRDHHSAGTGRRAPPSGAVAATRPGRIVTAPPSSSRSPACGTEEGRGAPRALRN